jgi:hypothetical protein
MDRPPWPGGETGGGGGVILAVIGVRRGQIGGIVTPVAVVTVGAA